MWKLFDKIRRTPLATVPLDLLQPAPPGARGLPAVDPGRCSGCGECVPACPAAALAYQDRVWTLDLGRCHFCGVCADVCPEGAIAQTGRYALATRDRGRLRLATETRGQGGCNGGQG